MLLCYLIHKSVSSVTCMTSLPIAYQYHKTVKEQNASFFYKFRSLCTAHLHTTSLLQIIQFGVNLKQTAKLMEITFQTATIIEIPNV